MFGKGCKKTIVLCVFTLVLASSVFGQTAPLEGTVRLKNADGSLTPVVGALVEIHRVDIKGNWQVKTDKSGKYVYLGLPLTGTFIILVSGPGIKPTWFNNIRVSQNPKLDVEAEPGDGSKFTLDQVQKVIAENKAGPRTGGGGGSEADRAKMEAQQKELEAKKKEHDALQGRLDAAITHYNQGVQLKNAKNLEGALSEFEQAATVDVSTDPAFAELSHKANANVAETRYQLGVDLFNQKKRSEAKAQFDGAVTAINKAIATAPNDKNPNINNDLIIYYDILAKNAKLLVEHYGVADLLEPTLKAIEQAQALDAANKNRWELVKGDLYRTSGKSDEAVAAYKGVIAAEPNNVEALYGIGLTLVASGDTQRLQEAANYLAEFVSKVPSGDQKLADRVAAAKEALEALKNSFKVEAEKPATRRRGRP